jgi:hypothetical protein
VLTLEAHGIAAGCRPKTGVLKMHMKLDHKIGLFTRRACTEPILRLLMYYLARSHSFKLKRFFTLIFAGFQQDEQQ